MNKLTLKDKAVKKFILLIILVIIIPGIILFFNPEILSIFKSIYKFKAFLNEYKEYSYLIYIALQVLQIVITILPQQVSQFAGGYFFGIFQTMILSVIGMIIGTTISYYLAKLLGQDFFKKLLGEFNFERYKYFLNKKRGNLAIIIVYIIPGFPKDIFAYIAGMAEINIFRFVLLATVARFPGVTVSITAGKLIEKNSYVFLIIMLIVAAIIILILFLNRKKLMNYLTKK